MAKEKIPVVRMGRPFIYPWEEWFSKPYFVLVRGRDFHCSCVAMTGGIRQQARKRGISVGIDSRTEGQLTVVVRKEQ